MEYSAQTAQKPNRKLNPYLNYNIGNLEGDAVETDGNKTFLFNLVAIE